MNTSKNLLGSLFLIVSGAWLLAVHAHPLVLLFLRATRPHSAAADPMRHFPFPPDYFGRFDWETWWPFVLGAAGMAIGVVFAAMAGVRRDEDPLERENPRKDCTREF